MIVVGLMSGTSVDGIDVAVTRWFGAPESPSSPLRHKLLHFETVPWSAENRAMIFGLIENRDAALCGLKAISTANFKLGAAFAAAALAVIARCPAPSGTSEGVAPALQATRRTLQPEDVALLASHGQTIFHDPPHSTLQIGEPSVIAQLTGITTVADFRVADMGAGGQGAPLTSSFDWHLLRPGLATAATTSAMAAEASPPRSPSLLTGRPGEGWRAVQNIGGIANATLLPPVGPIVTAMPPQPSVQDGGGGAEEEKVEAVRPLAFDSGPGNCLIDGAVVACTGGAAHYDKDGKLAASGRVCLPLLNRMLEHEYFGRSLPKTTGRELFSTELLEQWRRRAQEGFGEGEGGGLRLSDADFIATLTELTAASIAAAYALCPAPGVTDVILGGGGARNPVLVAALQRRLDAAHAERCEAAAASAAAAAAGSSSSSALPLLPPPPLIRGHEDIGINSDAKEAIAFALLGYLAMRGYAASVPSCTGARHEVVLGKICIGRFHRRHHGAEAAPKNSAR